MQGALKILSLKNKKAGTTINPIEKGRRWAPVVEPLSSDLCRGKYKGGPSMVGAPEEVWIITRLTHLPLMHDFKP